MSTLTLERVQELIAESREYDNQCKMPPMELVEQLQKAYASLPKLKHSMSPEQLRYFKSYISDTVYVAKGITLR